MRARLIFALVAVAVAAACSPSDKATGGDGAGADNSAGGKGSAATCALVPASLVNSVLGSTVGEPTQQVNSSVTMCTYAPTSGFGNVIVRFQKSSSESAFAAGRAGFESSDQPTTDVPGLLDQAYSSSLGSGPSAVNTLVARSGSVEILVTASAPIDKEKALIQKIADLLG